MSDQEHVIAELQQQMQLLLDEREITRLLLNLSRCVDQFDFNGLAELYAVDGRLITPWGTHEGRAGLAEYVQKDLGHFAALHHVSAGHEIHVEPGASTATARMTLLATHVDDSSRMAFTTVGGYYDIDLVREDGKWRLKQVAPQGQWRFSTEGTQVPSNSASASKGSWMPDPEA